jgi:hypothetical protein
MSVVMKDSNFWDITPCGSLKVNRRFGGSTALFHAGLLLRVFFDPEDGGDLLF